MYVGLVLDRFSGGVRVHMLKVALLQVAAAPTATLAWVTLVM